MESKPSTTVLKDDACVHSHCSVTLGKGLVLSWSTALVAWYKDEPSFDRIGKIHRR